MKNQPSDFAPSPWQPLAGWNPSPAVLSETVDGGQSFRWQSTDELWSGHWGNAFVQLRLNASSLEWRAPNYCVDHVTLALPRYLGCHLDWAALIDSLPWRSDPHLAQCIAAFPGLRILRQPFGDTLLGFLCSATKQIVQIKQMIALLAERHGLPLAEHPDRPNALGRTETLGPPSGHSRTAQRSVPPIGAHGSLGSAAHRLPTWAELADIPEADLRACLLGFRARYIHDTAKFIAARPGWLEETEHLPYPAAKARLLELPGVGEKVADCVLLFGAGKLEAFPVDTWILKALARRYGLDEWKPAQVAHFGRTHFGPLAGLAQQYLFSWERKFGTR